MSERADSPRAAIGCEDSFSTNIISAPPRLLSRLTWKSPKATRIANAQMNGRCVAAL